MLSGFGLGLLLLGCGVLGDNCRRARDILHDMYSGVGCQS